MHHLPVMGVEYRQLNALTGRSVGNSSEVRRADLFIKGSPTINLEQEMLNTPHNFTMTARNMRRHNYTSEGGAAMGVSARRQDGTSSSRHNTKK